MFILHTTLPDKFCLIKFTVYGIIDWNPPESQASPDTHKKVSVMDMTPFPYRHQLLSVRGNSYLHSQREFTMSFDMNSFSFFKKWDTRPTHPDIE